MYDSRADGVANLSTYATVGRPLSSWLDTELFLLLEGAALQIGADIVFTSSAGEFFVRTDRVATRALHVQLEQFLLPGQWDVVSAPREVTAASEDDARAVEILLRRSVEHGP